MIDQIAELQHQERNLLRVAAESEQVDPKALDDVLSEIRNSLKSLEVYKKHLESRHASGESLEHELFGVAQRLTTLRNLIDEASFEEKRLAVLELVRGIEVLTEVVNGKKIAVVTITYRFDASEIPQDLSISYETLILDGTPERAVNYQGGLELTRRWEG